MTNIQGLPEVFLIVQNNNYPTENLSAEEKAKNQNDAIAVAKMLIKNKPERKLGVLSAVGG